MNELESALKQSLELARAKQEESRAAYLTWMKGYAERVIPSLEKQLLTVKSMAKERKIRGRINKWKGILESISAIPSTPSTKKE